METNLSEQHTPLVKWAQRPKLIFLTICLEDCKSPTIELLPNVLKFRGMGGTDKRSYRLELEFLEEIIPEKSKFAIRDRGVDFIIEKVKSGPYWERLNAKDRKCHWIKVNFDKWVDEDDIKEEANPNKAPNFDDMSWNTLMETIQRNSPDDDEHPMEKLAKANESGKYILQKYQEQLQKQKQL